MQHRISVVVPTFNRAAFLAECLESLLRQTLPAHELVVVDDGCTDHTPQVLAAFEPRVTVLRTSGQLGKSGAVNLALRHITGDFVWVFDDDDVAHADALARYAGAFDRDPEAGFSYATFDYAGSNADG
ncbi:MAG: glycosyltransferase family 2 protein, partial [Methylibium sp.]|nr:glycosyltransferase family 2 protein [Methylibium sp.]